MNEFDEYYDSLIEMVEDDNHKSSDYTKLLRTLIDIPFEFDIPLDRNRETDAMVMRLNHFREKYGDDFNEKFVENVKVSVFEVLVALARRMDDLLCDPVLEIDRAHEYFWEMLRNLDIEKFKDYVFIEGEVLEKIDIWLKRKF